jgi:hypothetical protein
VNLIERLISTRNANTGLLNKRQILFGTFDQNIHSSPKSDTAKVLKQLQSEIMMIDMTPGTNLAASFGHLAGGYDAQVICRSMTMDSNNSFVTCLSYSTMDTCGVRYFLWICLYLDSRKKA